MVVLRTKGRFGEAKRSILRSDDTGGLSALRSMAGDAALVGAESEGSVGDTACASDAFSTANNRDVA